MGWTTADNNFGPTKYVVGPVLGDGVNYTSIQTAYNDVDAAGGGTIYIRANPGGVYSESLNLTSNNQIHFIGIAVDEAFFGNYVTIGGTATVSGNGFHFFESIQFLGVGDSAFNITAVGSLALEFRTCTINTFVNNGINQSSGDLTLKISDCTISGVSDGVLLLGNSCTSFTSDSLITSSTARAWVATTAAGSSCLFFDSRLETTAGFSADTAASANLLFFECNLLAINFECIQVVAGASVRVFDSRLFSQAASGFTVTGVGQLIYDNIVSESNVTLDPALTLTPLDWQPYAQAATAPATPTAGSGLRGTACFDNTQFTVTNGFVQGTGFATTYNTDTGSAAPSAGSLNVFGTSGVQTDGAGSTITISAPPFQDAAGNFGSNPNLGTFSTGAISAFLPTGAAIGSENIYVVTDAGPLTVQASATDFIRIGTGISSMNGTATSTNQGDSLTIRFDPASNTWYATSAVGAWVLA